MKDERVLKSQVKKILPTFATTAGGATTHTESPLRAITKSSLTSAEKIKRKLTALSGEEIVSVGVSQWLKTSGYTRKLLQA